MSRANPRFRRNNPLLPLPANNIYRLRFIGSLENQLTINTFYFQDELALATATSATLAAILSAVQVAGHLMNKLAAACSGDWTLTNILADCPTSPSLATQQPAAFSLAGSNGSGHEPSTVAAIITRQTAVKGQCGRGHIALPSVPPSVVTLSKLSTTTAYDALAAQMLVVETSGGHTYTPCLFSHGNRITKQLGASPLTAVFTRALLGTVRRRKIGRGK